MIIFELISVYGVRKWSNYIYCMWMSYWLYHYFFMKRLFFLYWMFGSLVKHELPINAKVYFWTLSSVPSIYILSSCWYCRFRLSCSFGLRFEMKKCESSNINTLLKKVFCLFCAPCILYEFLKSPCQFLEKKRLEFW